MLILQLSIYFLVLTIIWFVFLAFKLKTNYFWQFISSVEKINKIFMFLMIFVSILWTILIIYFWDNNSSKIDFDKYYDVINY